jgi:Ca-activated chloride channel family protein
MAGQRLSLRTLVLTTVSLATAGPAAPDPGPGDKATACNEDAMIVFDASGSMSGTERLGIGTFVTRIDKVRKAMAQVLPEVAPLRRIGLISYGPGPYNKCDNIRLESEPEFDAADRIIGVVEKINPAGRTPLTAAVSEAARVLRHTEKPAVIVLVTDGEETCGGSPCGLADQLAKTGKQTTVHVIGYRVKDYSWTGASAYQSKCLSEKTGGQYFSVETTDDLISALRRSLGCPYLTHVAPPARTRVHRAG